MRRRSRATGSGLALAAAAWLAGCDGGAPAAHAVAASASASAPAAVATARGVVEVPGGLFELHPTQEGLVDTVAVREGDTVTPGQLLVRLDGQVQQQEQSVAAAELAVAKSRLLAQQARLPAAERLLQRTEEALRGDAIEPQRADETRQALADLRSAVAVAEAEVALAQSRLAQVQATAKRLVVNAPQAGQVVRVLVQPGSRVSPLSGRPLLVLLPAQPLRVRAELNEAYAARVKPGQRAVVHADGDLPAAAAGVAYPGRVVRLGPLFGASRLDPDAQPRAQLRVLDCFIEFDGPTPLRAGQAVRVEIHD